MPPPANPGSRWSSRRGKICLATDVHGVVARWLGLHGERRQPRVRLDPAHSAVVDAALAALLLGAALVSSNLSFIDAVAHDASSRTPGAAGLTLGLAAAVLPLALRRRAPLAALAACTVGFLVSRLLSARTALPREPDEVLLQGLRRTGTVQVSPQGAVTGAVLDQEGQISRGRKIR
jgi:hypothetical protein